MSSSGRMNLSYVCEPAGAKRMRGDSASEMAIRRARGVRDMVERMMWPPGCDTNVRPRVVKKAYNDVLAYFDNLREATKEALWIGNMFHYFHSEDDVKLFLDICTVC